MSVTANPFTPIKPGKTAHSVNPKRLPFTATEIRAILDTVKTHPIWHRYHDLTMFLFYTGVRPSEAIGLQWKHIDWQRHTVTIQESLSRGDDGLTSSHGRKRKATKNQKVRAIDLHPNLYATL